MSFTLSSFAVPAVLLNPIVLLHGVNTLCSYVVASNPISTMSPHPFWEQLGPKPGTEPYFDMHKDDTLCWRYTLIMIVLQLLAYGRVLDFGVGAPLPAPSPPVPVPASASRLGNTATATTTTAKQQEKEQKMITTSTRETKEMSPARQSRKPRFARQRTHDSSDGSRESLLLPQTLISNGHPIGKQALPVRVSTCSGLQSR